MLKMYCQKLRTSGPNGLSKYPESREMDFGHFGETYFSAIFGPDDDGALRRHDKSEITWPLPHHTQGPNTS